MSQRLLGEVLEPFSVPRRCQTEKTRFVDHPHRLPRVAQRVQNRAKTRKKSNETSSNFLSRFRNDFKPILVRFCSRGAPKMKGNRGVFPTSSRTCEKCDFDQPSIVFVIFCIFESFHFRHYVVIFWLFFRRCL